MTTLTNAQVRDIQNVVHPFTNLAANKTDGPLILERSKGIHIYGNDGTEFIDGLAGLWCVGLGHGNEEMADAAREQIATLSYSHLFAGRSHDGAAALAEKIKELLPVPMAQIFYASSGSEANDSQIKIAWYAANAKGETKRKKILTRQHAYHGVTIIASGATGVPRCHVDFDRPMDVFIYLTHPHYWREGKDGETEEEFCDRLVQEMSDTIDREGPETICTFIAEPLMGAGGLYFPPKGYYEKINKLLQSHGIGFIDDEIICGFGRTGNWFGAETYGMQPTSVSMAKQLTSGYVPLSAIALNQETVDILEAQSRKIGTFAHGFTYAGHPLGTALGLKALEIYQRDDILGRVRRQAPHFAKRIHALAGHPLVGEVRNDGNGLIGGLELAADPAGKRPFDPVGKVGAHAAAAIQKHGVLIRAIGDTLAICPPMIIDSAGIDALFEGVAAGLDDTEAWVAKESLRG